MQSIPYTIERTVTYTLTDIRTGKTATGASEEEALERLEKGV